MSTEPDMILLEAEEAMSKGIDYLEHEMRGMRTGRASPALVEYIKIDYYGSPTDLKQIAAVSVPEATQLLIKPFDANSISDIRKALEKSDLGFNPQVEGKQIRLNIPALSRERRQQLVGHIKKMGEEQKIVVRNARRDANKHADGLTKSKDVHLSEDDIKGLKDEIQELTKKYEGMIDTRVDSKSKEIMEI